VIKNLNTY